MASTTIASQNQRKSSNKMNTQERVETRANYQSLISDLYIHKPELIDPINNQLFARLKTCNSLFEDVRTPREGVLDAIALKTISSFVRIQTIAIDNKATTEDAFKLIRKCAKIIKNNIGNSDDVFAEFYMDFCHCHKLTGTFSLMSGRLPTYWFEKKRLEKSMTKEKSRRTREIVDVSQRTPIVRIKKLSSNGEQTSKEIIHIYQCLQKAYKNNNNLPISFFLFTIHPMLFSRSVENIFHVSFLIKEGKVELFLDENQLPVLRPLYKQKTANNSMNDEEEEEESINEEEKNQISSLSLTQLVLSLDMDQWESLVHVFDIQMAMIDDK